MRQSEDRPNRWVRVLVAIILAAVVSTSGASAGDADPQAAARTDAVAGQPAAPTAAQTGQWAYFDPQTGKLGPPPADQAKSLHATPERNAGSPSTLVVTVAPGGGQMIDLQGRFQESITATLQPNGSVETNCRPNGNAPADATGQ